MEAPEGMKVCRSCHETKPFSAFARRTDTGGYRNQCMDCRNSGQVSARCAGCGSTFARLGTTERDLCARCRPPLTKPCATCGTEFVGSMDQRRYCSPGCRDTALDAKRRTTRQKVRLEALQAYGGTTPQCVCCGEGQLLFLALDHIDGGGHAQR
jgi:hypothetical protein